MDITILIQDIRSSDAPFRHREMLAKGFEPRRSLRQLEAGQSPQGLANQDHE
jgi:hypothetical protein